ncbi:MAG: tetratricopeptide repeat protein, partial [Actinomycetota bacterium]
MVRAVQLARSGHYVAAMRVLDSLPDQENLRPHVLDLQARIFAQNGRYADAKACWERARELRPAESRYRRALEAIKEERQRIGRGSWLLCAVVCAIALIALAAGFLLGYRSAEHRTRPVPEAGEGDGADMQIEEINQPIKVRADFLPSGRVRPLLFRRDRGRLHRVSRVNSTWEDRRGERRLLYFWFFSRKVSTSMQPRDK